MMVKKFIMILDSSKASGPDCIPVVVPKVVLGFVGGLYIKEC